MAREVVTPDNLSVDFLVDRTKARPVSLNIGVGLGRASDGTIFVKDSTVSTGAFFTLTTVPQAIFTTDTAGQLFSLSVVGTSGQRSATATVLGHPTLASMGAVAVIGTAIVLAVSGSNILASVASGTLDVKAVGVRII